MAILTKQEKPKTDDSQKIHPPVGEISDLLTFRLARLVALNDKIGGRWMKSRFNISLNEWRVLGLTKQYGPVRTGLIGDGLLMDKGQLSRIVRGLVDLGLIKAETGNSDARSVELTITEAGTEVHRETLNFAAARNDVVVAPLSQNECDEFMRLLQKITEHNEERLNLSGFE